MSPPTTSNVFVGRRTVLARLEKGYRTQCHLLLHGAAGTGKSRLIAEFARTHPLLYVPRCNCLGELLAALEPPAGLDRGELTLAARVHRLAARLPPIGRPIVVDHVGRVPSRVAHLLRVLMLRQPVWLLVRSLHPLDLGHVWPYLYLFERIDLPPFSPDETRAYLRTAPIDGSRSALLAFTLRLHRLSAGRPGTLSALVAESGRRHYDLHTAAGRRRLVLHVRISAVQAQMATG